MLDVHVIAVTWQSHEAALRQIRQIVFVKEQGIPEDLEFDDADLSAHHVLALNSAGLALGCGRLLDNGLIGRVAVMTDARGRGLGTSLMNALVDTAQNLKLSSVSLHAQEDAQPFYKKLDFIPTGSTFMEAGIKHVSMTRALPIPFDTAGIKKAQIVQSADRPQELLSADHLALNTQPASNLQEFADETAALEQLETIIAGARRSVRIYSPTLDHFLFDQPQVVELVSRFARSAPGCHVDILLRDSQLIVARGHMLVELGRRLDEKMVIRRLPDSIKGDGQSWVVVDDNAVWVQSEPEEYRGWSDTWNPVQAERFGKRYTQFWDRSTSDPELRLLRI